MTSLRRRIVTSDDPFSRTARTVVRGLRGFTLPAPRVIVKPALFLFLALRTTWHTAKRLLICEPLFKAYCTRYGRRLRTGVFVHWVQGNGDIFIGDDVHVDGKSSFAFASHFADRPTLTIGDNTYVGHNCTFVVGRSITIGRDCLLASDISLFDSSGHSTDPVARRAGKPPEPEKVRPIVVGDGVWIAQRSIIFPGVTIGEGSVVSAASVVRNDVAPYTIVAGNPARQVATLARPAVPAASGAVADAGSPATPAS